MIVSILYFIIIILGFGLSLDLFFNFTKEFDEGLYKLFSLAVIGFGFFGLSIFIMGFFRIPINYTVFLILSLGMPFYHFLFKGYKFPKLSLSLYQAGVVIILSLFLAVMLQGAFSYPWFENDDPWTYASSSKFVAVKQSYHSIDEKMDYNFYLFPHSNCMLPSMFGILNQISPNLYVLMKVFFCIFLLLGVMAFFLFAYHFSGKLFAFIALLLLVLIPCFVGHFIFNYGLSVVMLLIFLFSLSLLIKDKKYLILSAMMLGSVLIAHPASGFQAAVLLSFLIMIYFVKEIIIGRLCFSRDNIFLRLILVGIFGLLFSGFFYADFLFHDGFSSVHSKMGVGQGGSFSLDYSGGSYEIDDINLMDIIVARPYSRMDQQTGVGFVLFFMCIIGIIAFLLLKEKRTDFLIYLIMFIFYFLFLWVFTGGYFRFSLQNYRWWSMFAVFIALHSAATFVLLISLFKKTRLLLSISLIILFIGILLTSGYPRYAVQTSQWPYGAGWVSHNHLEGYMGLRELGYNKRIFSICADSRAIANNQLSMPWDDNVHQYNKFMRNQSINKTPEMIIENIEVTLPGHHYITLDSGCIWHIDEKTINGLIAYLMNDDKYSYMPKYSNSEFLLFGVVE